MQVLFICLGNIFKISERVTESPYFPMIFLLFKNIVEFHSNVPYSIDYGFQTVVGRRSKAAYVLVMSKKDHTEYGSTILCHIVQEKDNAFHIEDQGG